MDSGVVGAVSSLYERCCRKYEVKYMTAIDFRGCAVPYRHNLYTSRCGAEVHQSAVPGNIIVLLLMVKLNSCPPNALCPLLNFGNSLLKFTQTQ